jgi:tetratricopeptide (TPR) repeat protein
LSTKQYSVIVIALTLIGAIYFLGNRKYPQKKIIGEQQKSITVESLTLDAENKLTAQQKEHLKHLTDELKMAANDTEKIAATTELIAFWGGEVKNDELAVWYVGQKAKLENSEKNLTFAANLILENCINNSEDFLKKGFKAKVAKELFEKALVLNPTKDSLKIGLGGCYMFGANPENPMEGISKVLGVLQKDSTNAYAQKMLGYGNMQNRQFDKALERFKKSYYYNAKDNSLVIDIALLCKQLGKTTEAKEWKQKADVILSANPELLQAFDKEFQTTQ